MRVIESFMAGKVRDSVRTNAWWAGIVMQYGVKLHDFALRAAYTELVYAVDEL